MNWFLQFFRSKLYVKKSGEYFRVVGPDVVLKSITGFGGYVVIGQKILIKTAISFGNLSVGFNNYNGHLSSNMELAPVSPLEKFKLELDDKKKEDC